VTNVLNYFPWFGKETTCGTSAISGSLFLLVVWELKYQAGVKGSALIWRSEDFALQNLKYYKLVLWLCYSFRWQFRYDQIKFNLLMPVDFTLLSPLQQESPADAVKPARRKSMQKLLQFDVFRLISPNSISLNFKV